MKIKQALVFIGLLTFAVNSISDGLIGGEKYDKRIKRALDELKLKYTITDDNDFRLYYDLGEGRSQLVFINSNTEEYKELEIREIWSVGLESKDGANFSSEIANRLLRENAKYKMGGWTSSGKNAIFAIKISANADPDSLASAIGFAYFQADKIEKEYTDGKDEF